MGDFQNHEGEVDGYCNEWLIGMTLVIKDSFHVLIALV